MTREEVLKKVLESTSDNIVLELGTGFGKTRLALEKVLQWYTPECKILITIPRNVLIKDWLQEIEKWNKNEIINNITFTTYISFPKHADKWDIVICDEVHHLSERCRETLKGFQIKHFIGLSATINKDLHGYITNTFHPEYIRFDIKDAIEYNILPDPKIYLLKLKLDNTKYTCFIEKKSKKSSSSPIIINYRDKWKYQKYMGPIKICCTQQQYYNDISGLIEWYKRKSSSKIMRNAWLHKCKERLEWLACQKTTLINNILRSLKKDRVLVFCPTIKESESIKCPSINSKVGTDNLIKFNEKKIKHISAINCLNEGTNLTECKYGLWQVFNSSEIMQIQKFGRSMRHKNPVLIFPYYESTREEEIVKNIIEGYNSSLIHTINSIEEIK